MLEINNLAVGYGQVMVIPNISLKVGESETYAILGANGAGKTTLINAIMGFLKSKSGTIRFLDNDITRLPPHARAKMGMSVVPEGRRLFMDLNVDENLRLGGFFVDENKYKERLSYVNNLFPMLESFRKASVGRLSGGQQQMVAIARALMSSPKLLLLDEPSTGLMPQAVSDVFGAIKKMKGAGVSILLVEQNLRKAITVADRVALMQTGRIILEGGPTELVENEIVKRAYLG